MYGGWSTIPDVLGVRALATAGLDYVVVDLQHGGATEHDLPALTWRSSRRAPHRSAGSVMPIRPTSAARSTWAAKGSSCRTWSRRSRPGRSPGRAATRRSATGPRAGPGDRRAAVLRHGGVAGRDRGTARDPGPRRRGRDLRRAPGPVVRARLRPGPARPGAAQGAGTGLGGVCRGGQAGRGPRLGRGDRRAVPGERLPADHRGRGRGGRAARAAASELAAARG